MNTELTVESEASDIIDALKEQASTLLASVLTEPLTDFSVTSLGNFPYYWQNPNNLQFNATTYGWISSALTAGAAPVTLDEPFTNVFIEALSKVVYKLSTADQAALNAAQKAATDQQFALLKLWTSIYGPVAASGKQQPIDIIMSTIATTWAKPATDLYTIQQSKNLHKLLNLTPASGQPVLPVFANYLNALGSSISLQNATTMNAGYLSTALSNVQSATADNGGMLLDDSATVYHPAFAVSTPLADIINGLSATSNKIELNMTINRTSESELKINIEGGASFEIPIASFLTLSVDGSASYFSDTIATSSNTVSVKMTFTGVTLVNYGPTAFSMATGLNWSWMKPITDAIKNGSKDISGFAFSPKPNIDFSEGGPFSFLTGVAISNYPSVVITVESDSYESIEKTIEQTVSLGVSFLGIPLGGGSESTYSHDASSSSSSSTVTITLNPPPSMVAGTNESSTGWVLGAETSYPGAVQSNFQIAVGLGYPAYQLYQDNTGATYCSAKKQKSHAEGAKFVKACLKAHAGTSCNGKPWIADNQAGTIWP
ncbi:lamin tail domain-containing protein [Pedobacter cryoconitis]|uniref:Uncharacterized protein n=1 Tax=Pedobacter cryoconitis TaxID=188932 RepID=A0A327SN72_9SPHI|nr:lamin tail domain-containing protein [Pedobacter cryoconitis]RAJ29244.1 hypothetical protein LY11_02949 [Pedobacter cryoconitis]